MYEDFLEKVELLTVDLHESFLKKCMNSFENVYYQVIGKNPIWLVEAGCSEFLRISREDFERNVYELISNDKSADESIEIYKKMLIKFIELEKMPCNNKIYKDYIYRFLTYVKVYQQIISLKNILFEITDIYNRINDECFNMKFSKELNFDFECIVDIRQYIYCPETFYLRLLINMFFVEFSTILDYCIKIKKYFLFDYDKNVKNTVSIDEYKIDFNDVKDSLFDQKNLIIKSIKSVRNLFVHEGMFYSNLDTYEYYLKDGTKGKFILFPDLNVSNNEEKSGKIEKCQGRYLFYSQNNTPFLLIDKYFMELIRLFPLTVKNIISEDGSKLTRKKRRIRRH